MDSEGLLTDVSNSEAYVALTSLVEDGEIEPEQAEYGKEKYSEIHSALIQAMADERKLLEEAQELHNKLDDMNQPRVEDDGDGAGESKALALLQEDVEQAEAEAAMAQEREQLLQLEVTELQRQRNDLQTRVDEITEEHRQELLPQIEELRKEILEMEQEVFIDRDRVLAGRQETDDTGGKIAEIEGQMKLQSKEKDAEKRNLEKASQLPDKARRQADIVSNGLKNLQSQQGALISKIKEKEAALNAFNLGHRELEEEHARILMALDKGQNAIGAKEHEIDEIQRDVEASVLEHQRYLADRAHLDLQIKARKSDARQAMDLVIRCTKEKDASLQKLKDAEISHKSIEGQIPPLKNSLEHIASEKHLAQMERKQLGFAIDELKREEDVCMSTYLKEEAIGKEKAILFRLTSEEVSGLEKEVEVLKVEETERYRMLQKLGSQRDRMTRLLSINESKLRETKEKVHLKDSGIMDLKNVRKETHKRVRDFQQLYDLVKNQRNKFVNLIQGAKQATAEMKDKLKILGNELEILRTECGDKDKVLANTKSDHQGSIQDRDTVRGDLNQLSSTFRNRQSDVEEQIARIDKLNAIVSQTEKEMLGIKRDYENVVQARNYTGIMLIDRNDELCILYEKANVQEEVLKQGELELKRREDEIRILDLEIREVQRSIDATRKTMTAIPDMDSEIALLQKELLEAKRESETLSLALESPENKGRWRKLEGKAPNSEELTVKARVIEEKLNDKKERLLEKELVLEEIGTLSDRLRQQATKGSPGTLQLAKAVNEYQHNIDSTTRKMMAIVSELSMYQTTAMKLKQEKEALELEVTQAQERLTHGEAPTIETTQEWENILRTEAIIATLAEEKAQVEGLLDKQNNGVNSTAPTRPNAYIPEDLGIPKPYGSEAPFKPSEPGSTMRHIRKPAPREIVI
ncbi:hypothetical protein BSKO_02902 [Bryopsis sp. KO-2023]|nr:hypothetical protein BSKO_02902 [Bryopsis sp. KO-2023]